MQPLAQPPRKDDRSFDDWMFRMWKRIAGVASIAWSVIEKTGSNLTDIETRNHADLQNINTASYTHLTATNHTDLTDGGTTTLHLHDFDHITFPTQWSLGTFTHVYTLQELMNHEWSSGVVDGCALTDNGNGTISIAAGVAVIRAVADGHTTLYGVITSEQLNIVLTDNATNYIYLDYNAGVPQFAVSTAVTSFNCMDKCIAYVVHRDANVLHYIDAKEQNVDSNRKMRQLFLKFSRFIHAEGGSVLGMNGLAITATAGSFYFMLNEITHDAFDTSIAGTANANIFTLWYRDGIGGWTETPNSKVVSTTTYDSNTGTPATLGNNKFGVTWFYIVNDAPSELHAVMGQAEYANVADARVASPPTSIPSIISGIGVLVGFVIYEKSAVAFSNVLSSFSTSFTPGLATTHNGLSGLQGGAVNEYYHSTSAEYTGTGTGVFVRATSPTLVTPILGTPTSGTLDNCTTNTETAGTNNTQLASTAHVFAERTNTATLTNKTLTGGLVTTTLADNTSSLAIADAQFVKGQIANDTNAYGLAQGVVMTAAASGSSGITVADNANIDFGTGNFTLHWEGSLPDWSIALARLITKSTNTADGYILTTTNGKLRLSLRRGSETIYEASISHSFVSGTIHKISVIVVRETATINGSVTIYVDGYQHGTAFTITAVNPPVTIDSAAALYLLGDSFARYAGVCKSAITFNRALTAAEVLALHRNGISYADKWGSQTGIIVGNDTNFDGASNWANISCDTYDETTGSVLTATTNAVGGSKYFYLPAVNSAMVQGKRYSITITVDSVVNTWNLFENAPIVLIAPITVAGTFNFIYTATSTGGLRFSNSSGNASIVLSSVTMNEIGATLALEPEGVQANGWHDSSTNNLNASYPAAGSDFNRDIGIPITTKHTTAAGTYFWGAASSDGGQRQMTITSSDNGVNYGAIHTFDATSASGELRFNIGGTNRAIVSSTGYAVTGVITATTTIKAGTGIAVGGATPGAGGIQFPATQVASADLNNLDDYDEYTAASTACTGAITTACVWKLTKVGNKVTLTLPAVQGAGVATTNFTVGLTIPAKYRPAADFATISAPIINNAANQSAPGAIKVTSAGVISCWLNGTFSGNFTVTANAGLAFTTSVSWTI